MVAERRVDHYRELVSCKMRSQWAYERHPYRRFLTPPIPGRGVEPMVHSWVRFAIHEFCEGAVRLFRQAGEFQLLGLAQGYSQR